MNALLCELNTQAKRLSIHSLDALMISCAYKDIESSRVDVVLLVHLQSSRRLPELYDYECDV